MSAAVPRLRRFAGAHLPALLWAALVAVALAAPGDALPRFSDRIDLGPWLDPLFDKIVHFALFAGMAAFAARSFRALDPAGRLAPLSRRPLLAAWLAAVAYGGLTELAQLRIGERTAELGDFAADAAGALLTIAGLAAVRRRSAGGGAGEAVAAAALPVGDAEAG
jgi:VanZ family protein